MVRGENQLPKSCTLIGLSLGGGRGRGRREEEEEDKWGTREVT